MIEEIKNCSLPVEQKHHVLKIAAKVEKDEEAARKERAPSKVITAARSNRPFDNYRRRPWRFGDVAVGAEAEEVERGGIIDVAILDRQFCRGL